MSKIKVERHAGKGWVTGGVYISDDICWNLDYPAAVISVSVEGGVIFLSRDEAVEVAEGLRGCLLDG